MTAALLRSISAETVYRGTPPGTQDITATTFATLTGLSFTLTKIRSDTKLIVDLTATAYVSGTSGHLAIIAVRIAAADYPVAEMILNTASAHTPITGHAEITGVAAGTYTVSLRARNDVGSRTTRVDAGDRFTVNIRETWA
ncbi:hypothetical protein [Polymorphospora rubra]|uniref:hypothetical protein n=1 Tax=Polymorphospora rubra TaxID=338584 RepID=UPI001BB30C4A|nr:hypothetical protein [Polymorphospora rubra]